MRKRSRTDANQTGIVQGLIRHPEYSVESLASQGNGCPDIMVGHKNANYLFEIKNPDVDSTHQKLTPDQERWHGDWQGSVHVIFTIEDIFRITTERTR